MRIKQTIAAALAVLALTLVGAGTAAAHTTVKSTSPKAGSSVARSLKSVRVLFNGQIRSGTLKVYRKSNGDKVSYGNGGRDPGNVKRLTVALKSGLAAGAYSVRWKMVASDGHTQSGSFWFRLKK